MVALHTAFALAALVLGPLVFFLPKGDPRHRLIGRSFFAALLGVNATAFGIYQMTGGPSVFHALALLSLLTLWRGLVAVRARRIEAHLTHMAFAYAGLWAALGSRLPRLLPDWPEPLTMGLGIAAPLVATEVAVQVVRRRRAMPQSSCSSS